MNDPQDTRRSPGGRDKPLTSDLAGRIARARGEKRAASDAGQTSAGRDMSGLGYGMRLGTEFVAAILVGFGMGFLLDVWLGTGPWLMLLMLLIGFAAGVLNVTRSVAKMNKAAPQPPAGATVPDDDEDE
jgi:ATP synthase protein I